MVMPYSEMTPRIEWTIVVLLAVLGVVLGTAVGVPENESIMAGMEEEIDDPPDRTTMNYDVHPRRRKQSTAVVALQSNGETWMQEEGLPG